MICCENIMNVTLLLKKKKKLKTVIEVKKKKTTIFIQNLRRHYRYICV